MRSAVATGCILALAIAGCTNPPGEADHGNEPGLRFTEVTDEVGFADFRHDNGAFGQRLFPEIMGGAVAFLDSNGDGWQDVVVAGGGRFRGENDVPAVRLFENQRNGTFLEVTEARGLAEIHSYAMGLAVADFDNDGDDDIFFSTIYRDLLLRNDGRRFTEVGESFGVAGDSTWSTASIFFDADRDGWLDLFVGRYVPWTEETDIWCMVAGKTKSYCTPEVYDGLGPLFYQNDGSGGFVERSEESGLVFPPGKTLGIAEFDYDADGWPDLFVANDTEPDLLFRNQSDGTFIEVGVESGLAYDDRGRARAGMGIDVGPVDSTLLPTMFVGNFSNEMIGVYRYMGNGIFRDRAAVSRVGGQSRRALSFGLFLFDVDLDGDLDLFVANGHIAPEVDDVDDDVTFRQHPHLFLNHGTGMFEDYVEVKGGALAVEMLGRGAAYADYDLDGDLDIFVAENDGRLRVFRNEARIGDEGPNYLRVSVEGASSNRSGIGATVLVYVEGRAQMRRVRSGSSYLSQSELPVTFGPGPVSKVDSVVVMWPSGARSVRREVSANQSIHIIENERESGIPGTNE